MRPLARSSLARSSAVSAAPRSLSAAAGRAAPPALTEVSLTSIDGRLAQSIRFGRVAAMQVAGANMRIAHFRPGAIFAYLRVSTSDIGTSHSSLAIIAVPTCCAALSPYPYVRPGGNILLHVDDERSVERVLQEVAAIEAAGIDPCDVPPEHWRHVGIQLAAGLPVRPYGTERHRAWLQRKALGS